ncbi:MAG TPA: hypothetical protein VFV94_12055 [Polyangiaceae bacterium]|nr:hypothetical protein [Polyangiaceae bacterium]
MVPRLRSLALCASLVSLPSGARADVAPKKMCPGGQRPGISGCVDATPRARLTEAATAKPPATKPIPKPDPELSAARAKPMPLERQSRTMLIQELKRLEALLQKTPEGSPDFLIVLRRLGDGYAELEVLAERERAKASAAADDAERAAREAPKKKLVRGTGTVM